MRVSVKRTVNIDGQRTGKVALCPAAITGNDIERWLNCSDALSTETLYSRDRIMKFSSYRKSRINPLYWSTTFDQLLLCGLRNDKQLCAL